MPVIVAGPRGRVQTLALLDTGSEISSIDTDLLRQVGSHQVGRRPVYTVAEQPIDTPLGGCVRVLSLSGIQLSAEAVLAVSLPGDVQVLLGRDVMAFLYLGYDGRVGAWGLQERGAVLPASSWAMAGLAILAGFAGGGTALWLMNRAARRR